MTALDNTDVPNSPEGADFYVGRGPRATYLGSVRTDGDPQALDVWDEFANTTVEEYTKAEYLRSILNIDDLKRVWPWKYRRSTDTPWSYHFDAGSVYIHRFGVEMAIIRCNYGTTKPRSETVDGITTVYRDEPVRVPRDVNHRLFPPIGPSRENQPIH